MRTDIEWCPGTGMLPKCQIREAYVFKSGHMLTLPRGRCRKCGRNISLSRKTGKVNPHVAHVRTRIDNESCLIQ